MLSPCMCDPCSHTHSRRLPEIGCPPNAEIRPDDRPYCYHSHGSPSLDIYVFPVF